MGISADRSAHLALLADRMDYAPPDAADRRAELFRETPREIVERLVLGAAWAMTPKRIGGLPGVTQMLARDFLARDDALPDPESAFDKPAGLAGIVHDLSVPTLAAAYRKGLYPFAHVPPIKWWSPPERTILDFRDFHIAKTLKAKLKQARYTVTFDKDFEGVISACAGQRDGRWHLTWITPKIMRAYTDLFDAGYAHSFEVWNAKGELAGGGYGVATGAAFSGESQFSRESDTSKIGLTALTFHLARWGFRFQDGKQMTPTLRHFGFRDIPRSDYLTRLADAVRTAGKPGRWHVEADLPTIAAWKPVDINHA
jgi:leucyl/phenylalanyl-tRNA--protein transferase